MTDSPYFFKSNNVPATKSTSPTPDFLVSEKQLDDFLEHQQVYEKIQDMLDKFDIQEIKNSPYDLDLKPMDSTWDRLIKNHIDIDYSKYNEEFEEEFEK